METDKQFKPADSEICRAVIIDDEVWTRQVIRRLGRWEHFNIELVGEASDGIYGLELIRQVKPDIVLTDVCMPNMDGLELADRIRLESPGTRVIFISGYGDYDYVHRAMKLGAADYLLKPVKEEELNRQLQQCADDLKKERIHETRTAGLLNEAWARQFYAQRDRLTEALCSTDPLSLEQAFYKLATLMQTQSGEAEDALGREILVSTYYMLLDIVQQFLLDRGSSLQKAFEGKTPVYVFSQESTAEELIVFMQQLYRQAMEHVESVRRADRRLRTDQIRIWLQHHYGESISLERVAEEYHVSKEYLSKAFKSAEGIGFQEYLTSLRMERARELLIQTKLPVKDICEMTGYTDTAHFYKTFKKYFGMTPSEIKNLKTGGTDPEINN